MRITEISIEGENKAFATISRKRGANFIEVEIITPQEEEMVEVAADRQEELWSLATRLQATLDGRRGAGGDIRDYYRVLESISDF